LEGLSAAQIALFSVAASALSIGASGLFDLIFGLPQR
jgi:hypothetical protein